MEAEDAVYSQPLPLQARRLITAPSLHRGLPGSFPVTSSLPPGSAASIRPGGHVRETDCHHMQRGGEKRKKEKEKKREKTLGFLTCQMTGSLAATHTLFMGFHLSLDDWILANLKKNMENIE